jgi:hypothetical protein
MTQMKSFNKEITVVRVYYKAKERGHDFIYRSASCAIRNSFLG